MPLKVRLEFREGSSNKFWQVNVEGASHTVCYGKIGTQGSAKTKDFASEELATRDAQKLIAAKKRKGYLEVEAFEATKTDASAESARNFNAAAFEKKHGIAPPTRFQDFIAGEEAKSYKNMYVAGLPHYARDAKFKVRFCKPGFALFEENGIERGDYEEAWMPLAQYDEEESQFLAVNLSEPACPVAMWEHEDGMFHPVAESLDLFLKSLTKKSVKPPIQALKAAVKKATTLNEKEKYQEVIALLEPILKSWTPGRQVLDGNQGQLPAAYNLMGIAMNAKGRVEEALIAWQNSVASGSPYAALNVLDTYIETNQPEKVVAYAETLRKFPLDAYCRFWVQTYRGSSYILGGERELAVAEFESILKTFGTKDPEKIATARSHLEELADQHEGAKALVEHVLAGFALQARELSPKESGANRQWWDQLPKAVQAALAKSMNVKGTPSDDDLARILDADELSVDEKYQLDDVAPLARLTKLRSLRFHGAPQSLEPLAGLVELDKVTLNGDVIKDLKLPDTSNDSLFDAIEAGDIAAVEGALAAGAKADAKDDSFARSALQRAITNHQTSEENRLAMVLLLIENGADPYAQNRDDGDAFAYCGGELRSVIEEAFRKRGGLPPEGGPFLCIEKGRTQGAASLGNIEGFQKSYRLDDGVPLSAEFPSGEVRSQMRTDYPGHKKDKLLCDYHERHRVPIISEKLRDFLVEHGVSGVEFLPLTILDHSGAAVAAPYFILNALAQDCLDLEASAPTYNHIDRSSISDVKQLVIDGARVDAGAQIFRVKNYGEPLMIRAELASALESAEFSNIAFRPPRR